MSLVEYIDPYTGEQEKDSYVLMGIAVFLCVN